MEKNWKKLYKKTMKNTVQTVFLSIQSFTKSYPDISFRFLSIPLVDAPIQQDTYNLVNSAIVN